MRRFSAALAVLLIPLGSCALREVSSASANVCEASAALRTVAPLSGETEGAGPPVVMLGGVLVGKENWTDHARRLSVEYRVIRLQSMNVAFGLEDRPLPVGYSTRMESCALKASLDELGISEPAHLAGLSSRALIALDFALHYPERVRTLTLSEPPALWLLGPAERNAPEIRSFATAINRLRKADISEEDLRQFHCAIGACPGTTLEQARKVPSWAMRVRYRQSLRAAPVHLDHSDDPRLLTRFGKPILYIAGVGTPPAFQRVNTAFARRKPDARIISLPGGHVAIQVSLNETVDALRRHFTRASRP